MEVGCDGGEIYDFGSHFDDDYCCFTHLFWDVGDDGRESISGLTVVNGKRESKSLRSNQNSDDKAG